MKLRSIVFTLAKAHSCSVQKLGQVCTFNPVIRPFDRSESGEDVFHSEECSRSGEFMGKRCDLCLLCA